MSDVIENKVAKSGLVTIDLEEQKPDWKIEGFDIEQALWQGIALKEKDFRTFVKEYDWSSFQGKHVFIHCSVDAIVPTWAFMLIAIALEPFAETIIYGSKQELELMLWRQWIDSVDLKEMEDRRIIIKGCSEEALNETLYVELSTKLLPVAKTLMFGEPCSTVPLYKKR